MEHGESINTDILSDETFDVLCRICKRQGKNQKAEKYCLECQDYYCLKCVKVHEDVPSLNGHNILDEEHFPSGSIATQCLTKPRSSKSQPAALTEKCDRHSHHYTDMYCQNHDDVGCGTCMAVDHRLCQDIFYIPEFLQNNAITSASREIQQKLDLTSKTLKVHHENLHHEKDLLLKRKAETLENISKFRKEINAKLDDIENNTVANIEDKYKILIKEIEEGMKQLETYEANVTSARDKLASAGNNLPQNFVNSKKGKTIAKGATKCLLENQVAVQKDDIAFIPDQRIPELLEKIDTLGKTIQRSTETTDVTDNTRQSTGSRQKYFVADNDPQKETLFQITGSKKYSVKVQSDSLFFYCKIVSACTLEDGTIILSDNWNSKLKRVDSSTYATTEYYNLPARPGQVCPVNNQEVAVCLTDKKEVHFIEVKNRMTITNKITTDFVCYGLAYVEGNLYISDRNTSVYIYSVSGRKLKQFSKDQSGQAMFSKIQSLAVNEDGSRIYVTDFNNGLLVLDNDGQVIGKFNDSQLQNACGAYLISRGSLLVCGRRSNNVLQFRPNGELLGEVVSSAGNVQAICCNQHMSKMIIGKFRDDEIEVYDLV